MDLNITQTALNYSEVTQTNICYVHNIEIVIILLSIIAFCQIIGLLNTLAKEVLHWE